MAVFGDELGEVHSGCVSSEERRQAAQRKPAVIVHRGVAATTGASGSAGDEARQTWRCATADPGTLW